MNVVIYIFLLLTLLASPSIAANPEAIKCSYTDYVFIPHPDESIGGNKPRKFRLHIENNTDFKPENGGISSYYFLDTLDTTTNQIHSTVRLSLNCNALGVIRCNLDIKGKSNPSDYLYPVILTNFSSGAMGKASPFALIIGGLRSATKNSDYADNIITKKPDDSDFMPYFVPEIWITQDKINICID